MGSSGYLGADDGELRGHKKVEILNANENTWNITHDYPFVDEHIYYAPIVQHRGAFYVIGGLTAREVIASSIKPSGDLIRPVKHGVKQGN